jgi:dienelactone hydrolase
MAFYNYILLVVLILLIGFMVISAKQKLMKKGWLKRTVNLVTFTAIIFITCALVLFPNLNSIQTTGEYSYASSVLELTDTSRLENYKNDDGSRKLSLLVYYPDVDNIENNTCPLIVFSHGGISTKTSNLSLYKELASHGYVVASVEHTYHALSTEIDGKKIYIDSGYMKELSTEDSHSDIENSYECFQKWMKLRTDDINFVIDTFIEKAANENNSFYSLIDANSIGVAGHSLGGSAALGVTRQRDDIKAVIALESPYMYDITGIDGNEFSWNTNPYPCALMNVYSDSGYPLIESDNKYVQNKNYLYNNGNVEYYYIEGSNHYTLTDLVRRSPILCVLLGGGHKKPGYDTLEFINQKSLAFFDKYLKLINIE